MTNPTEKKFVTVLITTQDHIIRGKLELPIPSAVDNPTNENLLFYVLNSGNLFLPIQNCLIMHKHNVEFKPEEVKYYNINLNIVHSCQIVEDDK